MKVKKGNIVSIFFTLKLDRNKRLLVSRQQKPVQLVVGNRELMFGLDSELIGLEKGQKKTFKIAPENGYGLREDKNILSVNRSEIPDHIRLSKGFSLKRTKKNGKVMKGHVVSFNENTVLVDCNHPYAGEVLQFETEILQVSDSINM